MRNIFLLVVGVLIYNQAHTQDITIYKINHSYDRTIARLDSIIVSKGLSSYPILNFDIDTDSIAKKTRVVSFESEELSLAVTMCESSAALDLPLKIVVWSEDEEVYLGYIDPSFMKRRFRLSTCSAELKEMTKLLVRVINECIREA